MPFWLPPLLFAPVIGSFLGVLIRRLPAGQPVGLARSACEACGHTLSPAEMVPLLSYVALRGRCRACGAPIPAFHPAIEVAALLVAASAVLARAWAGGDGGWDDAAGLWPGAAAGLWADCALGWTLLALAWIDAEHFLLPDLLTLPLVLAGLAWCWWSETAEWEQGALGGHALGAALGYGGLRAVALAYRALRGREGMGAGDAKLLGACGAWLGWAALPWVLLGAAVMGLAAAGTMQLRGREVGRLTALPFGPFLAAACWLARLFTAAG